jgi:hypothetical protein
MQIFICIVQVENAAAMTKHRSTLANGQWPSAILTRPRIYQYKSARPTCKMLSRLAARFVCHYSAVSMRAVSSHK